MNDAPIVGTVDLGTINEDNNILISADQLLANATDVEGDALSIIDVWVEPHIGQIFDNPEGGWIFYPAEDLAGNDLTINFSVSDQEDGSNAVNGTALIDIIQVDDAPKMTLDNISASQGTLVDNLNGTWTLTPDPNFTGDIIINYEVDANGLTTSTSSTLSVLDISGDVLSGEPESDTLSGAAGDDVLLGNGGDDILSGGDGADTFIYNLGDGNDNVSGGSGGGWLDTIALQQFQENSYGEDWTLVLTSGSIDQTNTASLQLTQDAAGVISFSDGAEMVFQDIEQITW